MTPRQQIGLIRADGRPVAPPPDRGVLWYDHQSADQFLGGLPGVTKKERWVRAHLPQTCRIKVGRRSAWYELDIRSWLESRRGDGGYQISA